MAYSTFLFDLDDTLLDFKASEKLSFFSTLEDLGVQGDKQKIFEEYQVYNRLLWQLFELGKTSKDHLRVERFRKIFADHKIEIDPVLASTYYLDKLPTTVVLVDHAVEICEWLSQSGEIGIITNGIHSVQTQRIENSELKKYIRFVSVSEECGFAKPDVRFFEHTAKKIKNFDKTKAMVIGDRLEADILGAHNFGVDSCWFNPGKITREGDPAPKFEIQSLIELKNHF